MYFHNRSTVCNVILLNLSTFMGAVLFFLIRSKTDLHLHTVLMILAYTTYTIPLNGFNIAMYQVDYLIHCNTNPCAYFHDRNATCNVILPDLNAWTSVSCVSY